MEEYLKPQSPLYNKAEDAYFYPLTTVDQVLVDDKRLSGYNAITITEISFVLLKNKWNLVNGIYQQSIVVDGLNESYNASAKLTYTDDFDVDLQIANNASKISYAKQDADKITFYCLKNKPNIDIPIEVEVGL